LPALSRSHNKRHNSHLPHNSQSLSRLRRLFQQSRSRRLLHSLKRWSHNLPEKEIHGES